MTKFSNAQNPYRDVAMQHLYIIFHQRDRSLLKILVQSSLSTKAQIAANKDTWHAVHENSLSIFRL